MRRAAPPGHRAGLWLDGLSLGLVGTALSLLLVGLVAVPQRRAQRPGAEGVLALHLQADGGLRLWNRRVREEELGSLLRAAAQRPGSPPRLRLIPDPALPWGAVRDRLEALEGGALPLELQLP
jgi:hypothetical protein